MWSLIVRNGNKSKCKNMCKNVNYYDLSEEERIHILNLVLDENCEIYKRKVEDTIEVMIYNRELRVYFDEEQFIWLFKYY